MNPENPADPPLVKPKYNGQVTFKCETYGCMGAAFRNKKKFPHNRSCRINQLDQQLLRFVEEFIHVCESERGPRCGRIALIHREIVPIKRRRQRLFSQLSEQEVQHPETPEALSVYAAFMKAPPTKKPKKEPQAIHFVPASLIPLAPFPVLPPPFDQREAEAEEKRAQKEIKLQRARRRANRRTTVHTTTCHEDNIVQVKLEW